MVKAGFNRYLMEGFKSGIPPTEAMHMKKNTMLNKVRQKPIEYMSLFSNCRILELLFMKYFGSIADPIKNPAKAITNVMARLVEGLFMDNSKNNANRKSTINGLNI
jgi:hypothetical protein